MFCPYCGTQANDDVPFCPYCGANLTEERAAGEQVEEGQGGASANTQLQKTPADSGSTKNPPAAQSSAKPATEPKSKSRIKAFALLIVGLLIVGAVGRFLGDMVAKDVLDRSEASCTSSTPQTNRTESHADEDFKSLEQTLGSEEESADIPSASAEQYSAECRVAGLVLHLPDGWWHDPSEDQDGIIVFNNTLRTQMLFIYPNYEMDTSDAGVLEEAADFEETNCEEGIVISNHAKLLEVGEGAQYSVATYSCASDVEGQTQLRKVAIIGAQSKQWGNMLVCVSSRFCVEFDGDVWSHSPKRRDRRAVI